MIDDATFVPPLEALHTLWSEDGLGIGPDGHARRALPDWGAFTAAGAATIQTAEHRANRLLDELDFAHRSHDTWIPIFGTAPDAPQASGMRSSRPRGVFSSCAPCCRR